MSEKPWISIIGAGRVGSAIGRMAAAAGYPVRDIASRTMAAAQALADSIEGASVRTPASAAAGADIVFLTVPDDAIEALASRLSRALAIRPGATVVHCAGALSSDVLHEARNRRGCPVASFHPLMTFPSPDKDAPRPESAYCCIEGDDEAVEQLKALAADIGFQPLRIRTDTKTAYHAGAAMACNYLTALLDAALAAAEHAGIPRQAGMQAMEPLVRATVDHFFKMGPEQALTGPVARGDMRTLEMHIESLAASSHTLEALYRALGQWTAGLAKRKGSINEETARAIQNMMAG